MLLFSSLRRWSGNSWASNGDNSCLLPGILLRDDKMSLHTISNQACVIEECFAHLVLDLARFTFEDSEAGFFSPVSSLN